MTGSTPPQYKGPKNPVDSVRWEDAQEFARKLSQKEKVTYRLPTEAEWEYACRAGTTTEFYWGDDVGVLGLLEIGRYAWYDGNKDWTSEGTKPVGEKKPNAWGLYDMSGNVWEWCEDWYSKEYPAEKEALDPKGPAGGSYRVCRGGCWAMGAGNCRSAGRGWDSPSDPNRLMGLRLVRTIE